MMAWPIVASIVLALLVTGVPARSAQPEPAIGDIVERAVAAAERAWEVQPEYGFVETDRTGSTTRTYDVTMLQGSPYERLIAVNDRPLAVSDQRAEDRKLAQETARRRTESAHDRTSRLQTYAQQREQDRVLFMQMSDAFEFVLVGHEMLDGHDAYVLQATPRPGYKPPNAHAAALTGMRGRGWIDVQTGNWIKLAAEVVHPVSLAGVFARVEPGTSLELDQTPVDGGIWMLKHFEIDSRVRILLFDHRGHEEETYSDYRKLTAADEEADRR
jgi:hypothetical protein